MKNYFILSLILGMILASCASPKREISRNIDDNNLKEAYDQFYQMFEEEEGAKEDPEVWLLKADLHMHIFDSENPEIRELAEKPLDIAYDAINKAEELDDGVVHMLEIQQKRMILSELVFNKGLQHYEVQDFPKASEEFFRSYDISTQLDAIDTMTLFNAALAAEQGGINEKAKKHYKTLIEMELDEPYLYLGLSNTYLTDREEVAYDVEKYETFIKAYDKKGRIDSILNEVEDEREIKSIIAYELETYSELVEVVLEEEPYNFDEETINEIKNKKESLVNERQEYEEKAIEYLTEGREKYPEDIDLIFGEANFYLLTGKTQEAREILDIAIEKDPDNPSLHFAFGANYEKMAEDELLSEEERQMAFEEAVKAYKKAIELDEEFVDAYYNLGALYFNQGIRVYEEAEETLRETRDFEQYQEDAEEFEELWLKAQPNMEQAKELIDPEHQMYRAIVTSLFQLYARTDQKEKQEEIEKEYQKLFEQHQQPQE